MTEDTASLDLAVRQIYSAAAGRAPWQRALDDLALSAGARSVQLLGLDRQAGGILFSHAGSGTAPEAHLDYLRAWHRADPGLPALVSSRPSEWLHCHERFDESRMAADPFWQQYLIPAGGRYRSGTKIVEDEHLLVLFGVHHGSTPLATGAFDRLERFRGHLVEAISIYRHLRAARLEQLAAAQLLQGIAYPVVLVDAMRGILFRNRAAEEALREGDYIVDRGGLLGCAHPKEDAELTIAVQAIDRPRDAPPGASPARRFLRLRRTGDGSAVGVYVSALIPRPVTDAFGQPPAALLVFHDTGRHERLDPFVVAELYGLTPAEARVAVRLAKGQDVAGIARETGRSVETVRTHVKSILLKTGLERQSELVRALASLQPLQGPAA
jgi:DNA-binding CsgD family transcriptional regulator